MTTVPKGQCRLQVLTPTHTSSHYQIGTIRMRDRLRAETNAALKAQDKPRLSALRLISAALQQSDIAAKTTLPDAEIPALLQKMIKQRRESLAIFEKAGRTEQAKQEATEIAVIEEFLPKQMSEAEAKEAIAAAIKE